MPRLFVFGSYVVFFWAGDGGEPVHVHVSVRKPTPGATKIWLTSDGGALLASNGSAIPPHDLRDVLEAVAANHVLICRRWQETFGVSPAFYR